MNPLKSIIDFHLDMMRPRSGVSHKRYVAILSFYAILLFGILDLWHDIPEILYIILAGLAGLEGALSLAERQLITPEEPEIIEEPVVLSNTPPSNEKST